MKRERKYYKVLSKSGIAMISKARWSLPYRTSRCHSLKPGMWHTVMGKLSRCYNGLHLASTPEQIRRWGRLNGSNFRVFEAEVMGRVIADAPYKSMGKFVARTVRLVHEIKRGTWEWNEVVLGEAQTAQTKETRP